MQVLKQKLIDNPKLTCVVGLKDASQQEIDSFKQWLDINGIKYTHKTTQLKTGKPLPYKGLLVINALRSGMKANDKNLH